MAGGAEPRTRREPAAVSSKRWLGGGWPGLRGPSKGRAAEVVPGQEGPDCVIDHDALRPSESSVATIRDGEEPVGNLQTGEFLMQPG